MFSSRTLVSLSPLASRLLINVDAAQYFQTAGNIVILGDGGIKEQGTWQDIKAKTSSFMKFVPRSREGSDRALVAGFDRLGAQLRARDEAGVDLSRQTGDFALYGN